MADTKLVLCDALCFVKSKFGNLLSNTLKVTLSDFYSGDVLAIAKQQLLDDILDMKSSVKFPHVARRRDGDNKAAREIDDIISLFTCFDENILFDYMFLVTLMRCHLPGSMREICMVFSNYWTIWTTKSTIMAQRWPFCPETCRPFKVESHL